MMDARYGNRAPGSAVDLTLARSIGEADAVTRALASDVLNLAEELRLARETSEPEPEQTCTDCGAPINGGHGQCRFDDE
jgi:hypothetical protein